jgi:hypothetical protein
VHLRLVAEACFLAGYNEGVAISRNRNLTDEVGAACKHSRHRQDKNHQQGQNDPCTTFDFHFLSPVLTTLLNIEKCDDSSTTAPYGWYLVVDYRAGLNLQDTVLAAHYSRVMIFAQ